MNRLPLVKEEIERLIVADLKGFPGCEQAVGVIVAPVVAIGAKVTWTVSHFNAGCSDDEACGRALQHIVAQLQRTYDLVTKH